MPEVQVRSELACERPHRVILRSGRNAQARVALASCFRDEPPEQNRADALPSHRGLDAERDFGQRVRRLIRWMQLRRAANRVVFDVGYDDRVVFGASGSIAFNEAVIEEAVKAIMPACRIEPQQMIAQ